MLLARYTKWNRTCVAFWLRFGLQGTKVGNDAIDMEGNEGLSAFSNVTYKLVKQTSKEMEWQKEGTTYSTGTWGSDYRMRPIAT